MEATAGQTHKFNQYRYEIDRDLLTITRQILPAGQVKLVYTLATINPQMWTSYEAQELQNRLKSLGIWLQGIGATSGKLMVQERDESRAIRILYDFYDEMV